MARPFKTTSIILLGAFLLLSACRSSSSSDPAPAALNILPGREAQVGPTQIPPSPTPGLPTVTAIPAPSATLTAFFMLRPVSSSTQEALVSETDSDVANPADSPQVEVIAAGLNIRSGPGLAYPPIAALKAGDRAAVLGRNEAGDWLRVDSGSKGSGWIFGSREYVRISGNTNDLPRLEAPPLPRFSTDGSGAGDAIERNGASSDKLIFTTGSGGEVSAINVDGSGLRRLAGGVIDPVVSPDGQQVAFTRWETGQDGALGSLWLINIDGTSERVILNNVYNPRTPVWSPDGNQIAISMQYGGRLEPERKCGSSRPPQGAYDISVSREDDGDIKFCYTLPPDPHWGLRLVDVTTGAFEDLPRDTYSFSPAWDPANPWRLVYDGDRGLVSLDLNRGTTRALTSDVNDRSPVFSPDGRKIAVSYRQDDHWEIHLLNADGSGRRRLTQTSIVTLVEQQLNGETPRSFNNAAPAWSPNGTQIAFVTDRTGRWEIWVMNVDGSNQRPLFATEVQAQLGLQYQGVNERMLNWVK